MRFFVVESRDEDDRDAAARGRQLLLQLQSVHAGHLHINDETCGVVQMAKAEKALGRFKSCGSESERFDEQGRAPANRSIVVNDRDEVSCHFKSPMGPILFGAGERIYWALVDFVCQKAEWQSCFRLRTVSLRGFALFRSFFQVDKGGSEAASL